MTSLILWMLSVMLALGGAFSLRASTCVILFCNVERVVVKFFTETETKNRRNKSNHGSIIFHLQDDVQRRRRRLTSTIKHSHARSASANTLSLFTLMLAILSTSGLMFLSLSVMLLTVALEAEAALFADSIRTSVASEIKNP